MFQRRGSPPQVRGKLSGGFLNAEKNKDHPRRCGENGSLKVLALQRAGSPPQVRGKLNGVRRYARFVGITPAGAGKTAHTRPSRRSVRDHPRRCGENCAVTQE